MPFNNYGASSAPIFLDSTAAATVPTAKASKSANQSIPNITNTIITFDTEDWDTDNIHDLVTNNSRLTCNTAGKYRIEAQIQFAGNATGYREAFVKINGSFANGFGTDNSNAGSVDTMNLTFSGVLNLAVGDYIELSVYQTSGGALNATTGTKLAMTKMDGVVYSAAPAISIATTVAGLAPASDGKMGRLRLGASPYDFIDLTYDATYGKWVSAAQGSNPYQFGAASTVYPTVTANALANGGQVAVAGSLVRNYKLALAAGLSLQGRLTGWGAIQSTGANALQFFYDLRHINKTTIDIVQLATAQAVALTGDAGGNPQGVDSGWIGFTTPGAPKDLANLSWFMQNQAGGATNLSSMVSSEYRWVG